MTEGQKRSCYKCQKRHIGCHSKCEAFKEDSLKNEKRKAKIKAEKHEEFLIRQHIIHTANKKH